MKIYTPAIKYKTLWKTITVCFSQKSTFNIESHAKGRDGNVSPIPHFSSVKVVTPNKEQYNKNSSSNITLEPDLEC